MKKSQIYFSKKAYTFLVIIYVAIVCNYNLRAQTPVYFQTGTSTTSTVRHFDHSYMVNGQLEHHYKMGFDFTDQAIKPFAKYDNVELRKTGDTATYPLHRDSLRIGDFNPIHASIKYLGLHHGQLYGIYQTSSTYSGLTNYLQDPLQLNLMTINGNERTAGIGCGFGLPDFSFSMQKTPGSALQRILVIHPDDVTIYGKTITDQFQLLTNPGDGKVLLSDREGNGSWNDVSRILKQYWKDDPNTNNIYESNEYLNVGFGTVFPRSKLHVVNGNIMISATSSSPGDPGSGKLLAPGSSNGSILFGSNIGDDVPLGEWGIEYYTSTDYSKSGLNFWKPFSINNHGSNYNFYLQNTGNVGINTSNPESRVQINEGSEKLSLGSAKNETLTDGTSYIGFNSSRGNQQWVLNSDGQKNGGDAILGDISGNLRFIVVPSSSDGINNQRYSDLEFINNTKMILGAQGNVGISTEIQPDYKLAVNGKIICEELKVQLKTDWKDCVFDSTYNLKTLEEVEQFIKSNHHLPDVPNNNEVKIHGINTGEMHAILMQKIEELTIYVIELQKEINKLKEEKIKQ